MQRQSSLIAVFTTLITLSTSLVAPFAQGASEPETNLTLDALTEGLPWPQDHDPTISEDLRGVKVLVTAWIMSGVEIIRRQHSNEELEKLKTDRSQLEKEAKEAASRLLDHFDEFASSTLASRAMGGIMKTPIAMITQFIKHEGGRAFLTNIIQYGISTFVGHVGWQLGSEGLLEARARIHSPEDAKRAKRILLTAWNAYFAGYFRSQSSSDSKAQQESLHDRKILNELFQNWIQIFITDDSLRSDLFSNVWRLQLATGDEVSVFLADALADALLFFFTGTPSSTMVYLAAGTLGSLASNSLIPKEDKDRITQSIRNTRAKYHLLRIRSNSKTLTDYLHRRGSFRLTDHELTSHLEAAIKSRIEEQNDLLTTYFEQFYWATQQLETLPNSSQTNEQEDLDQILHLVGQEILAFLSHEAQFFRALLSQCELNSDNYFKPIFLKELHRIEGQTVSIQRLITTLDELRSRMMKSSSGENLLKKEEVDSLHQLSQFYYHGYTYSE